MKSPLDNNNEGVAMPGVTGTDLAINTDEFQYRVGRFFLNGGDDDTLALEALLTRSISDDVIIMERKDSISPATGDYVAYIIYMEKRL